MIVGVVFCILYIAGAIFYKIKEGRALQAEQLLNDQHEDLANQYLPSPSVVEEVFQIYHSLNKVLFNIFS